MSLRIESGHGSIAGSRDLIVPLRARRRVPRILPATLLHNPFDIEFTNRATETLLKQNGIRIVRTRNEANREQNARR